MNKKVMAEATDNKRLEEQNSIALEQEEQKDETEVTSEIDSETESKEQENLSLAEGKISDTEEEADVAEVAELQLRQNETLENTSSSVTSPTETLSAENKVAEEPSAQKSAADEDKSKVEEESSPSQESPKTIEEEALVKSEDSQLQEDDSGDNNDDNEEEDLHDDNVDSQVDYSHYSKKQLVEAAEALLKESDIKGADRKLQEIKTYFDEIENEAYSKALEKHLAEGGEKDGFEYKADTLSARYQGTYKKLKERKSQHFAALEAEKESNLHSRQALLEKLRNLVDSEETNQSISELKKIQQEWKSIGQAPRKYAKSLWASYNALVYRFYDNISIYSSSKS